jgi:hypothetical protein
MTRIDSIAAKEAAVTSGPDSCPLPSLAPTDGGGRAGGTLHSTVFNLLIAAPRRRLWRSQPSAREGVWVNTAQPPDDPETSWPSTVFNPFASEPSEMVVPTGPPGEDLDQLPETDGGYGCPNGPVGPDGNRRLMARRRHGRHAAPSASIGSRLARKLAANR